jgi:hypothetical protein
MLQLVVSILIIVGLYTVVRAVYNKGVVDGSNDEDVETED